MQDIFNNVAGRNQIGWQDNLQALNAKPVVPLSGRLAEIITMIGYIEEATETITMRLVGPMPSAAATQGRDVNAVLACNVMIDTITDRLIALQQKLNSLQVQL